MRNDNVILLIGEYAKLLIKDLRKEGKTKSEICDILKSDPWLSYFDIDFSLLVGDWYEDF